LKQHPLNLGEQGPTLTLDDTDVALYNQYIAVDGSVATVQSGEQISEYQALETMLLPSANNMADSLARWAYGSLPAYATAANQYVKSLGMTNTTVGSDASGFDPSTTSTATDLVKLGLSAIQNPVLAHIVSQPQADVPVAGTVRNTNFLLGQNGIVGIKTGNNDQDAGVFIGASKQTVGGQQITVVSAIMNASNLRSVLTASQPLLMSAPANFSITTLAKAGTVIGTYTAPWGDSTSAIVQHDITMLTWGGAIPKPHVTLYSIHTPQNTGAAVGTLTFSSSTKTASSPIILKQTLRNPAWGWRIFRHQ